MNTLRKKGFWEVLRVLFRKPKLRLEEDEVIADHSIPLKTFYKMLGGYYIFYSVKKELLNNNIIEIFGSPRKIQLTERGRSLYMALKTIVEEYLNGSVKP